MIQLDLDAFEAFCSSLTIPSRDSGLVPLSPLFGTQRHLLSEIASGLERGVHEFVILKGGRQIGGTTFMDALSLYLCQAHDGTQGMVVADDDGNRVWRRDVMVGMLDSLPPEWRMPVRLNNQAILAWQNGSRLGFEAAGVRSGSNLGRSRGLNFLHADEVGSWQDQRAVAALRAALSKKHPHRLYVWNSTARGIKTVFHEMWKTATTAISQHAIFLAWWMREDFRIAKSDRKLWKAYGLAERTTEEWRWIDAVKRRYRHTITDEQLAWYRWQLAENMMGDETMMAQEFGCVPEDCFQAWGDKFIPVETIRQLRLGLDASPRPEGWRYEWGATLDATTLELMHPEQADLCVWEQPDPTGVYLIAGHPAFSSSANSGLCCIQVWRVWPDAMVQVAEYAMEGGPTYQCAWAMMHLAGAYRTFVPCYMICEVGGTGFRVLEEMDLIKNLGHGLSGLAKKQQLHDFMGSVNNYYYWRPDNIRGSGFTRDWKTQPNTRPWLLNGLSDTLQRGYMTVRSEALIDELAMLRRGETGDNDQIEGASGTNDARAICAAMAVECWLKTALPDLERLIAKREPTKRDAVSAQQRLVQTYLRRAMVPR